MAISQKSKVIDNYFKSNLTICKSHVTNNETCYMTYNIILI